jgi:dihydrofolate reductase
MEAVVAMTPTRLIANNQGVIPWNVPEDRKLFRSLTEGKTVVMGRKTYEAHGKALPDRTNIVLTRDHSWWVDDAIVVHHPDQVFTVAGYRDDVVIIGGGEIFELYFDKINKIHLSTIYVPVVSSEGVYFPEFQDQFDTYQFAFRLPEFEYGVWYRNEGDTSLIPIDVPMVLKGRNMRMLPKQQLELTK